MIIIMIGFIDGKTLLDDFAVGGWSRLRSEGGETMEKKEELFFRMSQDKTCYLFFPPAIQSDNSAR